MLELYETLHRTTGVIVIGVEECRAMVPFDNRECSPLINEKTEAFQRPLRIREMLQYETDKDVVKTFRCKRETEDISVQKCYVSDPFLPDLFLCTFQRIFRYINRNNQCIRIVPGQDYGLGTGPTAGFNYQRASWIAGIIMKKRGKGPGLIGKPFRLAG